MSARAPETKVCLGFEHDAELAAKVYARTFPKSAMGMVWRAPCDYSNDKTVHADA